MTTGVNVILKSKAPSGVTVGTFELIYPRAELHEEFLTHRALSRNASSSRATPSAAMIREIDRDPFVPEYWGIHKAGMSDGGPMNNADKARAKGIWMAAKKDAIRHATALLNMTPQPHKQQINLLLRPFEHIRVVVTATDWDNFFALRTDSGAKPLFQELAKAMWFAYEAAPVQELQPGEWHLPYIQQFEWDAAHSARAEKRDEAIMNLIMVSAARCARTSYKNHSNKVATFEDDKELYERLMAGTLKHASPTEHQCTPDTFRIVASDKKVERRWDHPELHGNLTGWIQHRKTIPGENIKKFNGVPRHVHS